jgi:hypothetical protein
MEEHCISDPPVKRGERGKVLEIHIDSALFPVADSPEITPFPADFDDLFEGEGRGVYVDRKRGCRRWQYLLSVPSEVRLPPKVFSFVRLWLRWRESSLVPDTHTGRDGWHHTFRYQDEHRLTVKVAAGEPVAVEIDNGALNWIAHQLGWEDFRGYRYRRTKPLEATEQDLPNE